MPSVVKPRAMGEQRFREHAARRPLTDELHARPFTPVTAPARLMHFAFLPEADGAGVDATAALDHLRRLLAALGGDVDAVAPPSEGGVHVPNHVLAEIKPPRLGRTQLKWERHTEFLSYVFTFEDRPDTPLFDAEPLAALPEGWLDDAGLGRVVSATLLEVRPAATAAEAEQRMREISVDHLAGDTAAVAWVSGGTAVAMGDFRIDANGFTRFVVLATPDIGPRRLGRVAQRLIEIETYRTLSMLALPMARRLSPRLGAIETSLADISRTIAAAEAEHVAAAAPTAGETAAKVRDDRQTLADLTEIAAELERLAAETAFRFGAGRAYEAIVDERLAALREERISERPLFGEFFVRRYKPAMRTVRSVGERLSMLSERAQRAANLLRTRVDVSLQAQNQALLHSMDSRAQLQLRLQQTVEGLSVVAISYYAVSLAGYVLAPFGSALGMEPKTMQALVALPIIGAVWWFVRRIRQRVEKG